MGGIKWLIRSFIYAFGNKYIVQSMYHIVHGMCMTKGDILLQYNRLIFLYTSDY